MQSKSAPPTATVPATIAASSTAVAMPDNRTEHEKYLDEIAPGSIVGRLIKFGKEGTFITADDGEGIPEQADFFALCDETLVGYIKFNGEGTPPDRIMGLLYNGFIPPIQPRSAIETNHSGNQDSPVTRRIRGSTRIAWCYRTVKRSSFLLLSQAR